MDGGDDEDEGNGNGTTRMRESLSTDEGVALITEEINEEHEEFEFFEAMIPMPKARASHKLVWRIYLDEVL